MYNPEYKDFFLNPSNTEEQKKFHDFRNNDCVRLFKYLALWNAGATMAMFGLVLYYQTGERVVYLLLDAFPCLCLILLE